MSATAGALSGGSTAHPELAAETEAPSNESLGIILFIVSEAVMFGAFFAQYFYNRILSDNWPTRAGLPPGFERVPSFPLPLIMTVLLVASGFTAHWAQTAIRRDDRDQFQGWMIVTIVLGVAFLGVQGYEYATFIFQEHFNITSGIYGTVFFSLTGLHGLHVTIGALLLIGVLIRAFLGHFSSRNHFAVEGTILYWHFVDVVWIALYATLYLL
ncbi:MAG: heme-copper oxidase subunit III [Chloroflexi bacterium]|nr:heme-copper oxidase subunit III [Chloroflexota bacterium]MBV9131339.1 heme-copper oxidase subunit III [Chloroflexota bacterium]MBV9896464.1 heme-copper oxidase subunit III [Chloroflexota bacterium]